MHSDPTAATLAAAEAAPARTSDLVRLMWLASPALPIGGFSYSEGLEAAIDRTGLRTPADVSAWLQDQLQLTLARSDLALAASITGASVANCLSSYAFGWAENMVQAAVKAVPLGQNAGQRILADLAHHITRAVADALVRDDDNRQAFAPMLAILSAQHETQYSRLFRS